MILEEIWYALQILAFCGPLHLSWPPQSVNLASSEVIDWTPTKDWPDPSIPVSKIQILADCQPDPLQFE